MLTAIILCRSKSSRFHYGTLSSSPAPAYYHIQYRIDGGTWTDKVTSSNGVVVGGVNTSTSQSVTSGSTIEWRYKAAYSTAALSNISFTTLAGGAIEVDCDLVLKATKVDGVYDSDPVSNPNAVKYNLLTYETVLAKQLGVMDLTAICLVRDHSMPVRVFNMNKQGALVSIIRGENEGTLIDEGTDS